MEYFDFWYKVWVCKIAKSTICVSIVSHNRDGWVVSYKKHRGFMPLSELTDYYSHNPQECIDESFPCIITYSDKREQCFKVSHKKWVYYQKKLSKNFEKFSTQSIVKAIIKGITKEGAILDINGCIAFIPDWKLPKVIFLKKPIGTKIEVFIESIDVEHKKLYLCISQAEYLKWEEKTSIIKEKLSSFKKEEILPGIVKRFVSTGVIVEVNGFDGIVYLPNLTNQSVKDPSRIVKIGQTIEVVVLDVILKELTLSLGVKQVEKIKIRNEKKRIKDIASKIKPGSKREVTVVNFTPQIVNINLGENIPGIILREDLAGGRIPISQKVFEGMQMPVVFLREDDGVMYFSTKLLESDKYDAKLYDYSTEQLLNEIGIRHNSFVGKVRRPSNSNKAYINYLYAIDEEDNGLLLCNPYTGIQINLLIDSSIKDYFTDGEYYQIRVKALPSDVRKEKECPYLFELDTEYLKDNLLEEVPDPYRKLVEHTFMKQTSPSSNASLANLLEEVGQNMYDSKERMFFELLQNADDASATKGVQVNLQSVDGYILLTHNGLPFNRKDFVSITSAARSTKTGSKKKTGYKGIGFKSVFTNSTRVIIKTGGFFFTFDKDNPLFDDFDKYYFYVNDITDHQKQIEYIEKFKDEKEEFKGVESIPWQLLPKWTESVPEELYKTIFSKRENVAIALSMSNAVKSEYLESIKQVLNEPKFMLFLRHTSRIMFKEGDYSFILAKNKAGEIVTLQSTLSNTKKRQYFIVREAEQIEVNTEYFKECGVDIVIGERINSKTNKKEKVFLNSKGEKIASIPSRIAEAEDTLISYAFAVNEKGKYTPLKQSTTLFAYLPMTETRYPFPFYINADFILKSSREGVQSDNPWNFFILYNIGKEYAKWIGTAASVEQPDYLNLLLTKTFDEETTGMRDLSKAFNKGYLKSLQEEPFIINDRGEIVRMSQIVLDHTGISDVIGPDNYCLLVDCKEKRLPSTLINSKILNEPIFSEIEHISDVTAILLDKTNRKYFRNWMQNSLETEKESLYNWLIKQNNQKLIRVLPLFSFDGKYRAIDELNENFLFIDSNLSSLVDTLKNIGFICYDGDIVRSKLYHAFLREDLLSNEKEKSILRIIKRSEKYNSRLSVDDKISLYSTLSPLCDDLKLEKELKAWKLFLNVNNVPCRLDSLIKADENENEKLLFAPRIINEDEYKAAQDIIADELLPIDKFYTSYIYSNWNSILLTWTSLGKEKQWTSKDYCCIYDIVSKYYNAASVIAKLTAVQGISIINEINDISTLGSAFIWSTNSFKKSDEVFFSIKLADSGIYNTLEKLIDKPLPDKELITTFTKSPFKIKNDSFLSQTLKTDVTLSSSEIESVLELCKSHQEKFFVKKVIEEKDSAYIIRDKKEGEWQFYYGGSNFISFITNNCEGAISLPHSFEKYHNEEDILSSKALFEKVFNSVNVQDQLKELLPIVLLESREIKCLLMNSIKSLTIKSDDFTKDSLYTQLFNMFAGLFSKEKGCPALRSVISIEDSEGNSALLESISMQGTVSLGNHYFGLEDLHPDDEISVQKCAQNVLTKMRQVGISDEFLNSLFNLDVKISADEVYESLNTKDPLVNGEQLAFVLIYAKLNRITTSLATLTRNDNTVVPILNSCWLLNEQPFVDQSRVLPPKYHSFLNKFPKTDWDQFPLGMKVKNDAEALTFMKDSMTDVEKQSLFDYLYSHKGQLLNLVTYLEKIKTVIGINTDNIIISTNYSLPSESLPTNIIKWIDNSADKKDYLVSTFQLKDEKSRIVILRKYFTERRSLGNVSFALGDTLLQDQLCLWISTKQLHIDSRMFANLSSILDESHLKSAVDNSKLSNMVSDYSSPDIKINKFTLFKIDGQIPKYSYLPKYNNYVVQNYCEGDYAIISYVIYVDKSQWGRLDKILQEIAVDNTNGFTANDYLHYRGGQNTLTDDEAERLRAEINRLRALLERNSIEVSTAEDEFGGLSNEEKRAALEEAKQRVLNYLRLEGYNTEDAVDDGWTCIDGVKDVYGVEYPLVVRSYKDNSRDFELNAGDWEQLTRSENSMLWIVTRNGCQSISFYDLVRNTRDRISFSFSTSNLDRKNRITALAEIMRYFKGIHFDFGSLVPSPITMIQKFNQPEKELKEVLKGDDADLMPS